MADNHPTLLHRWFDEVWNQGNEAAIDELLAEDAVAHGLPGPDGEAPRGAAGFKPLFQQYRSAFPDIRIDVEDVMIDGDRMCARCIITGNHTGPGLPMPPTGQPIRVTGTCIVRVRDGKIVEGWNHFDFLSMYQQLGLQLS
ncbi:MAG: ester cyclase [Acetobacteraceae bacterium]